MNPRLGDASVGHIVHVGLVGLVDPPQWTLWFIDSTTAFYESKPTSHPLFGLIPPFPTLVE
jgi:hypothetical protein